MFIYQIEYKAVESPDYSALACQPGQKPKTTDGLLHQMIPVGGKFVSLNGTEAQHCSANLVFKYEDKVENMKDWLADYMGGESMRDQTGYVGLWPDEQEIEHLYYYVDPTEVKLVEFFFAPASNSNAMTSIDGFLYFIKKDGQMFSVSPSQYDILVEDPEEAKALLEYFALCNTCLVDVNSQKEQITVAPKDAPIEGCSPEFQAIYARLMKMLQSDMPLL